MTERPIVLRAEEVRAVLAGTQTQVRRPVDMRHVSYLGGAPETSDPAVNGGGKVAIVVISGGKVRTVESFEAGATIETCDSTDPMLSAALRKARQQDRALEPPDPAPTVVATPAADWGYWVDDEYGRWAVLARGTNERGHNGSVSIACPLGRPGDRLWVRETWGLHAHLDFTYWHRDSIAGVSEDEIRGSWEVAYRADADSPYDHWRPSIHMPRWASRITLEVLDVGVDSVDGEWMWAVTVRRMP